MQQGEGGADARNQSGFEARLRQQAANGNATAGQVSRFAGASGLEAQYRAALDIITEIQAKGREVAALDLASKIFPPNVVDRIPNSNGQIVPIAPGNGGGGNTTQVSVHNYAGGQVEATAERRSDGNIDILVREIEGRMAQRGYRGQGPFRGVLNTPATMRG